MANIRNNSHHQTGHTQDDGKWLTRWLSEMLIEMKASGKIGNIVSSSGSPVSSRCNIVHHFQFYERRCDFTLMQFQFFFYFRALAAITKLNGGQTFLNRPSVITRFLNLNISTALDNRRAESR